MVNYRIIEEGKLFVIETEYMGRWYPIDEEGVFGWSVTMNESVAKYESRELAEKQISKIRSRHAKESVSREKKKI